MKLRRIEDQNGSSSGAWQVAEIPGLVLFKFPSGWGVKLGALSGPEANRVFKGPAGNLQQVLYLYRQNPRLRELYSTRRELITALEISLDAQAETSAD